MPCDFFSLNISGIFSYICQYFSPFTFSLFSLFPGIVTVSQMLISCFNSLSLFISFCFVLREFYFLNYLCFYHINFCLF